MFSRKRVFITGLIGFAGSSALGGAATSFGMLVAARTLQGVFGAFLAPAAQGTLISIFRDPRERGRAFGVFGSVAGGGGAVGLILGGVLTEYLSWRWAPGWTALLTLGSLGLGVVLLAAFGFAEQRVSHPLLPLPVILDRTRGGAYVAVGVAGIAIFSVFLFLTYYLQQVKGYSPVTCGLAFLPMFGCILISSNTSSIVTLPRFGPRVLIAIVLLPSKRRLLQLREAPSAVPVTTSSGTSGAADTVSSAAQPR